ncbi:histidine kinase [Nostoc sp. 3335mG]|nr:histidine kinase [Nostoc sp. 3335mG]
MTGEAGGKGGAVLLSGDNPQIAKGSGDAPVAAYIAAVPGWKQAICRDIDALVVEAIPRVRKAVKWNTPLYGLDGETWILSMHCFKAYVRITFFAGTALDPMPEKGSKVAGVRYHDITEEPGIDRARFLDWVKQAALLPGEKM